MRFTLSQVREREKKAISKVRWFLRLKLFLSFLIGIGLGVLLMYHYPQMVDKVVAQFAALK